MRTCGHAGHDHMPWPVRPLMCAKNLTSPSTKRLWAKKASVDGKQCLEGGRGGPATPKGRGMDELQDREGW